MKERYEQLSNALVIVERAEKYEHAINEHLTQIEQHKSHIGNKQKDAQLSCFSKNVHCVRNPI